MEGKPKFLTLQPAGEEVEMSSTSSKQPNLGSPKSKVEGVDKSAKKAMTGDMQKGKGSSGKSKKLDSNGQKTINEDGGDKVCPLLFFCVNNESFNRPILNSRILDSS